MPKPSKETLKKNKEHYAKQVEGIINYIKTKTKDDKDAFGFALIPFYRTIEQAERNDWKKLVGGMISNIQDTSLMKTALCEALEVYAESDHCSKDRQLKHFEKNERPSALAVELAMAIGEDCDNFDKVLLMHLGEMKDKNDDGLIYASFPHGIHEDIKKNNGELNIGRCPIFINYNEDDFAHVISALIIGYCKKNGIDIEGTANRIFGMTMSADCEISEYPKENK